MLQLTHKIELNPNNKAKTHFKKAFGCARLAYNWGLAKWKENYEKGIKSNHLALKKEFNALKKTNYPFVYEVTKYATAQPFTHLNLAFQKFFRDLKLGKVSYPRFKRKREYQGSFYIGGDQIKIIQGGTKDYLKIPNLPKIKMTERLRLQGKINGATISQKGDKFYVSIQTDITQEEFNRTHKPIANNHTLGIDTGIKAFASLSNGLQIQAPKPLNRLTRRLKRLSRQLSKKRHSKTKNDGVKKSRNYLKASLRLNRLHTRIANTRNNFLHKLSTALVRHAKTLCMESLKVSNMLKNSKLAKALSDVSISAFNTLLEYKAKYYGRKILRADAFYPSSKTCSSCGSVKKDLTLSDRVYRCDVCGVAVDRDFNASVNLVKHLVSGVPTEFTPADMTALLVDLSKSQLITSMVETGIQQKPLKIFSIDRIL
ncbi:MULTISPECIES: RNA-guided endonuclease InsQ/TnpB family protein [Helicobacter]|uniref:RNA-guided endonuclease InsQ/TnpB family protein n=1 Tax=Helicobacter TaxID=209 RepID=UPI000CF0B32D|nr:MULTISPECIES: RNA-guided endonuclease TnpB family protein [Helicobacter]BEG58045.1 IS200/IS605 family element transposase accessory protein TnpB [Helicobacter sp. NHP21005]